MGNVDLVSLIVGLTSVQLAQSLSDAFISATIFK